MLSLKRVMVLNAISCILFGATFLAFSHEVGLFLHKVAPAPNLVLILLGSVLIFNGLHLMWAASKKEIEEWLVVYFVLGDLAWVGISLFLIFSNIWITSQLGIIATLLVAVMVGAFGILQFIKRKQIFIAIS